MKIVIGTKNSTKIAAIKEIISDYNFFKNADVSSIETESGVGDQPKSLEETIRGAQNRAKNVFKNCNYSLGIESGLMKVPETKSGYMDVCVCAIYDGKNFHLGLSSAFEYPKEITKLIIEDNLDATQAANKSGLTENPKLGSAEGIIGIITKGRITRKEYTKQAIRTALIHLENPELY
ncbi:MAG: inosine/xanthosine triphosphatase [Candidatus Paceibacterota bacterium]|jgi:inosine/xanthosine triphosphatase